MTTMLEKIARAIGEVPATSTDDVRHVLSEGAIERVARAALMAMREPDRVVVDEIASRLGDGCSPYEPNPNVFFTAMIDAILVGETET